jgi:hypothetical protein
MDWKGYTIEQIDGKGHRAQITGRYKPEKHPDLWWWKCIDCVDSAGVYSDADLHDLEDKGLIGPPMEDEKDLSGETKHPDENGMNAYTYYGGYGY